MISTKWFTLNKLSLNFKCLSFSLACLVTHPPHAILSTAWGMQKINDVYVNNIEFSDS